MAIEDGPHEDLSKYEPREKTDRRERRRGELSRGLAELFDQLAALAAGGRLAWYRQNRGQWFFSADEIPARIGLLNECIPTRRQEIADAAGCLLRHEFDILGSGPTPLGAAIDWQRDFKSGISWRSDVIYPNWNWRKVDRGEGEGTYQGHFYSVDDPSDLKVPWDLSSFFHLAPLAEAYCQTADEKYAREIITQLGDWHRRNPVPRGVNWTCAMVVGIRLANMTFALRLIEGCPGYAEFMDCHGVGSIVQHARVILDDLEVDADGRRNNHYLNNLVGLGFGAVELAGHAAGTALLEFVHQEIEGELSVQFSPDGANYEGGIPYHRFATESVLLPILLLDRNGRRLSPAGAEQLRRVLEFIDVYTKPNGLASQIGDNDNGRILVLHNYLGQEYRDHRHIVAVGAGYLDLPRLTTDLSGQSADTIWLLGKPAPKGGNGDRHRLCQAPCGPLRGKRSQSPLPALPALVTGLFPHNGFAVAKTREASLIVRCGRINPMSGGGHNHCDQLSFEFQDCSEDLIVDPGAMIYSASAAKRNAYRSTAAHNTLQLDDQEQQAFEPRELFAMHDRCDATVDLWRTDSDMVVFRGHHSGYGAAGWRVEREIVWDLAGARLKIIDIVAAAKATASGESFCGRLHLAAGVTAVERSATVFDLHTAQHCWRLCFQGNLSVSLVPGHVSPSYGVELPATIVQYRFPALPGQKAWLSIERAP